MIIEKRDGTLEQFNLSKIRNAISNVLEEKDINTVRRFINRELLQIFYRNGINVPFPNITFSSLDTSGRKTIDDLLKKDNETVDLKELRIGLRTITVNRDKIDDGENFAVTVNGVSVFLMGANYIPEDVIYNRITIDTYKRLIDAATFANYNCLRVWGGGYYPDEEFLGLLDENGILLWQDLMFACLVYEVDDAFLENVKTEVDENIRRISNHACLALVAGNNEMEYAWSEWDGYRDHSEALRQDYLRLFEEEFPKIIGDISPDIFYWPSSPSKGGGFKDSQKENAGDTHYWVVWHGEVPFDEYENHPTARL